MFFGYFRIKTQISKFLSTFFSSRRHDILNMNWTNVSFLRVDERPQNRFSIYNPHMSSLCFKELAYFHFSILRQNSGFPILLLVGWTWWYFDIWSWSGEIKWWTRSERQYCVTEINIDFSQSNLKSAIFPQKVTDQYILQHLKVQFS